MSQEQWDLAGAAESLRATPQDSYDTLLGSGTSLVFEQVPSLLKPTLELYPDRLCARFRSYLFTLNIANIASVRADEGRVRVEAAAGKLKAVAYFDAKGSIIFNSTVNGQEVKSKPTPEPAKANPEPEAKREDKEDKKAAKAKAEPSHEEEKNKDRVMLTGRVGRDPVVTETKNKRKMLKVSLAVHDGGEKTTWHNVLFFDAKAVDAAAKLAKGALVTIVGYKHQMETTIKTPKGQPGKKTVEVIYGAAIQTPRNRNV